MDEILATFVLSDCLRFEPFEDGNIIVLRHTEGQYILCRNLKFDKIPRTIFFCKLLPNNPSLFSTAGALVVITV